MRVYTGGTFDVFHAGHVQFLQKCAHYGLVTVSLNTDQFIAQFKGKPPVMPLHERMEILKSCKYVDDVTVNLGGQDSKPTIEAVDPDFIIIGDDWAPPKDYHAQMGFTQKWLDERNITLKFVPYCKSISSTIIKQRIKDLYV